MAIAMSKDQRGDPPRPDAPSRPRKALTIGAVAKILGQEFDDISISKIRYLEDQKLLAPRRTQGGYRLYSSADVDRLRTILRLQRDQFLPRRVIRRERPSARATSAQVPAGGTSGGAGAWQRHPAQPLPRAGAVERGRLV